MLFSPVTVISAPWQAFTTWTYFGYIIFFSAFFTLIQNFSGKKAFFKNENKIANYLEYAQVIILGLAMIYALNILGNENKNSLTLLLIFSACTICALSKAKKIINAHYTQTFFKILYITITIFIGFHVLEFKAQISALIFSFAMACTITSAFLCEQIVSRVSDTQAKLPEASTRKKRRIIRFLKLDLEQETNWRWLAIALLLTGPATLVGISMTPLFPSYFSIIALLLLFPRQFLVLLPVKGTLPKLDQSFSKEWTLFCYLMLLGLLLTRLIFG